MYGSSDQWIGLGIFFDSFDNDNKVQLLQPVQKRLHYFKQWSLKEIKIHPSGKVCTYYIFHLIEFVTVDLDNFIKGLCHVLYT